MPDVRLLAAVAITAALVSPTSAQADVGTPDAIAAAVAGSTPSSDGLLWAAAGAADDYWTRTGLGDLVAACPAAIGTYREPVVESSVLARGQYPWDGRCGGIFVERRFLHEVRRDLRAPYPGEQRRTVRRLCRVIVHERGHTLGLRHASTGIMVAGEHVAAGIAECARLALRAYPRKRTQ